MNRSNGTPVDVSEIDRFLGLPQTVAVPIFFATYIRGGLWQESAFFCGSTHFVYFFAWQWFSCYYQAIPRQKERGVERRERPPLFCRSIGKQEKGCVAGFVAYPGPPPFGGSLSSDLSLREGSEP